MDALGHFPQQESSLSATDDYPLHHYIDDMPWSMHQLAQQHQQQHHQHQHQHHHHQHQQPSPQQHLAAMTQEFQQQPQQDQQMSQHSTPLHHHQEPQPQQQQQQQQQQQPERQPSMNPSSRPQHAARNQFLQGEWHFGIPQGHHSQQQQQQQQRPQPQQHPHPHPHQHQHQHQHQNQHHGSQHNPFTNEAAAMHQQYATSYANALSTPAVSFVPHSQPGISTTMTMTTTADGAIVAYAEPLNNPLAYYHDDLQSGLVGFPIEHRYSTFSNPATLGTSPPTDNSLDSHSTSSSECGWVHVDPPSSRPSFDSYVDVPRQPLAISNPSSTLVNTAPLHNRAGSDSSHSDLSPSVVSIDDFPISFESPPAESSQEIHASQARRPIRLDNRARQFAQLYPQNTADLTHSSPTSSASPATSPTSMVSMGESPPSRSRKSPSMKVSKPVASKVVKKEPVTGEKKVGRRRGPLRPEQRKQAGEIRKLRACLRCKFLKKTCDKGDPCAGCQPSHARLWQVPCTRIDIKDISYFMKDWRADYERHVTLGFSIANIKGYSNVERGLWITHGYGFVLPIQAREVYVRDDSCFNIDWIETIHDTPRTFDMPTARLTAGADGIPYGILSQYLDRHIDQGFEKFVDNHFEGVKFLTEILKTVFRYYRRTQLPIIRKALKLVLAYNLTMHVTLIEGLSEEEGLIGKIDDESSKHFGKTLAPVMINFQIKCALAEMWRELQRDVLEELSALYSSVYSGEKLKNWPTIFMLVIVLLSVWEQMQFDAHYRCPDSADVEKFCNDMESTPVGVIVGLFSAISQKLPSFAEWDTRKHHTILNSNPSICESMTEVREHVLKYDDYLRSRSDSKFDREDFDCLTNKFLSKLVIRA